VADGEGGRACVGNGYAARRAHAVGHALRRGARAHQCCNGLRVGPRAPLHVLGYPRREPAMELELDHGRPRAGLARVYGTVEDARAGMGGGSGAPGRTVRVSPAPLLLRVLLLMCARYSDKDGWEMSTEDLDSWDATLQVCLARVLDDGGDATRVLNHLAGTISSTHIPTSASATRAAELMLSHLDIPPDAPALLGFVNDTLVSTYPPEPRNKVASMWLIRAATRVVDTCSVKKLREVVSTLQEGLGVWVADQYQVLTAEEYAFDVGGFLSCVPRLRVESKVAGRPGRSVVSDDCGVLAVTRLID